MTIKELQERHNRKIANRTGRSTNFIITHKPDTVKKVDSYFYDKSERLLREGKTRISMRGAL